MPFVKIPVNTDHLGNDSVEGGVIFPLAVKLPADWDMGLEVAASEMRNEESPGHHAEFVQTITFDHSIIGKLSGYGEFFSEQRAPRLAYAAKLGLIARERLRLVSASAKNFGSPISM